MRIILQGKDRFRINERIQILRTAFIAKFDPSHFNVATIDLADASVQDLHTALNQSGLFTKKLFVVIYNLAEAKLADQQGAMQQLTTMSDDAIAVVVVPVLNDLPTAVAQALVADSKIESFPELSLAEVSQWITRRVQAAKRKIAPAAVQYLVQTHGTDLWALHSVLQQLIYAGGNGGNSAEDNISVELVQQYVASPLDENIFHLSDALSAKQTKRALQLLHDQFAAGANPFYLLTMLARQIELLLQAKQNTFTAQVAPYARKKALEHAKRFSAQTLIALHTELTEMDYKMKTTTLEPAVLFDRWVVAATLAERQ